MSRRRRPLLVLLALALLAALPALTPRPAEAAGTADLAVSMVGSAKSLKFGRTMTFSVTATNLGPDAATGVVVSIGVSDSFANFGGECPDDSVSDRCDIGTLAAGASVTIDFEVMAANSCCPEGVGVAIASVSHDTDTIDPEPANDSARAEIRFKGRPLF